MTITPWQAYFRWNEGPNRKGSSSSFIHFQGRNVSFREGLKGLWKPICFPAWGLVLMGLVRRTVITYGETAAVETISYTMHTWILRNNKHPMATVQGNPNPVRDGSGGWNKISHEIPNTKTTTENPTSPFRKPRQLYLAHVVHVSYMSLWYHFSRFFFGQSIQKKKDAKNACWSLLRNRYHNFFFKQLWGNPLWWPRISRKIVEGKTIGKWSMWEIFLPP